MAVSEGQRQLPIVELHLDPLGEFLPEGISPGGPRRLLRIEPAEPTASGALENVPIGSRTPPKGRWSLGAVMLGVGLFAGFLGGVAVVTYYGVRIPGWPVTATRVDSGSGVADVQPRLDRAASSPAANDPVGPSANEVSPPTTPMTTPPLTRAADAATKPDTPVVRQRAVAKPPAVVPASLPPGLYVQSNPAGASVYLDGRLVSTTPFQLADIAPGQHDIRIDLPGYRDWSASVNVEAGTPTRITATLERQ